MKTKEVKLHYIHNDTKMSLHRTAGAYFISFDFEPNSRKAMIGVGTTDWRIASVLANYFKQMSKQLKEKS